MAMESGNFSEDAGFLFTSFPTYDDNSRQSGVNNPFTITFLERLEIEDFETAPSLPTVTPGRHTEAWMLRRIEPVEPVDYLEFHRRLN